MIRLLPSGVRTNGRQIRRSKERGLRTMTRCMVDRSLSEKNIQAHELHRKLKEVDLALKRNYTIALEVCDQTKPMHEQPRACRKAWNTINGMTLVKLAMMAELSDLMNENDV